MVDLKYLCIIDGFFFFFFWQPVLDQTTDLKGMADLGRKVIHLLCSHLWW